jgi:hypothetical protein
MSGSESWTTGRTDERSLISADVFHENCKIRYFPHNHNQTKSKEPTKRKKKFGKTLETMEGYVIFITGLLTSLLLEKLMMIINKSQISIERVT